MNSKHIDKNGNIIDTGKTVMYMGNCLGICIVGKVVELLPKNKIKMIYGEDNSEIIVYDDMTTVI